MNQNIMLSQTRRTGNILNFLVLFCLIFSTVVSAPVVQAQGPAATPTQMSTDTPAVLPTQTETPTPISETSTPSAAITTPTPVTSTEIPLPSVTLIPAVNDQAVTSALVLSTSSDFVTPGGSLILNWKIDGLAPKEYQLVLQITLPDGVSAQNIKAGDYDPTTHVLTLAVTDASGQMLLEVGAVTGDLLITATLFENKETLAEAQVFVPVREQFTLDKVGGAIEARAGKIKVEFPNNVLPEAATITIGEPAKEALPNGALLGVPFEINAYEQTSGKELKKFSKELMLTVSYADLGIPPEQEGDLHVYWYNEKTMDWEALPTWVDKETKTLQAITDHFTIFDLNVSNWQSNHLPTVDAFQVSGFTGAGTYSLPIQVPSGPGGFQPSLALTYNSQVVDQSTLNTQASWVGMGWSLDSSYIELDSHGTGDWLSDDTYLLQVGGLSSRIVADGAGGYRTTDENFWKITNLNNTWVVQDKQGTTYYFEYVSSYPYETGRCPSTSAGYEYKGYRWSLSRVRNIFNQEIQYTYAIETKAAYVDQYYNGSQTCKTLTIYPTTATYPEYITYAGGRYRIRFDKGTAPNRLDYETAWGGAGSFNSFEKYRLQNIYIEQDADGNGVFESILRRYQFVYKADTDSDIIFPGRTWSAGGKTTTLKSVQEFGVGGTTSLPATTFTYGDNLHLTQVNNGYGGTVQFTYETNPWYYATHAAKFHTNLDRFGISGVTNPCSKPAVDPGPWAARSGSVVTCENNGSAPNDLLVRGIGYDNEYNNVKNLVRPGGVYKLTAYVSGADSGTTWQLGLNSGMTDDFTGLGSGFFKMPATAGSVAPLIKTIGAGTIQVSTFKFELMTSVYRVKDKIVSDGNGHTYNYTYSYSGAAVNDLSTSPTGQCGFTVGDYGYGEVVDTAGCYEYFNKFSEFRGHTQVTETGPDGVSKITAFHQSDTLKGRPSSVTTKVGAQNLGLTIYSYTATPLAIAPYGACNVCSAFLGLKRYWVYTSEQENGVYALDGITFAATRSLYTYNSTYGNLLTQTEQSGNGTTWSTYRSTSIDYFPNVANYLVGFAARQQVKDAGGAVLAESLNIYDGNTIYNQMPTVGKLAAVRTWIGGTQYSQATFGYDTWGNKTSVTAYSGYGTASAAPATGAATATTVFDPIFHSYPISQTTPPTLNVPAGLTTTWLYDYDSNGINDYILGVPTKETDLNGNQTSATYDAFGRVLKLIRPGDDSASPTLTMAYQDTFPFSTTITQKINPTQSYTVQRIYDGMGRQTRIVSGGINVDTVYESPTQTKQSLPYTTGETVYYTTSTLNPTARSTTITAPDGTSATTISNGLVTTMTDPRGNATVTTNDVWGRVISVMPPTGPAVAYTYDEMNRLKTATRGGVITSLAYDNAGRKISMSDPDMGNWSYAYDALGSLTRQTDARGQRICLYYDALNRLSGKHYRTDDSCPASPAYDVTYTYDSGTNGKGLRTGMTDISGSTTWLYDTRGRMFSENKTITGAGSFNTSWTYNAADMPVTMTYPDNEVVTYEYNPRMLLDKVLGTDTYVASTTYDSTGRMDTRTLGNSLTQDYNYYAWDETALVDNQPVGQGGRLKNITVGSLQNLNYVYDSVGNIRQITNPLASETNLYGYDTLNRLTSWTLNSATETYTYNASTGNLETKAGLTLQYNDAAHVHAATNAGGNVYQYDTNGNMTSRNINSQPYTLQYDAENRLTSVSVGGVGMLNSPAVPVVAQQEPAENTTGQNHLVFYKLPALQTDLIFADGFESGNLSAWSNTTGGTDLSVTASATAIGNYGMQTVINDTTDLMVMDASPNNETHYSARFYLDPNSVKIGTVGSGSINLISDNSWHFCLYLNQEGVNYSLTLCGDDDADNWLEADPVMITDAWQAIEIEWLAASAPGANDGFIKLFVGDVQVASLTNIDNDTQSISEAWLGVDDIPAGTTGTMYFDAFESHQGSHIGLDPNGPSVYSPLSPPDLIFADNFESNNFSAWSNLVTDSGDLSLSTSAAHQSNYGLQALIDDTATLRADDKSPVSEPRYRARFYFDPNSLAMNSGTAHNIFDGYDKSLATQVFRVELFYESGAYKLRTRVMNDAWSYTNGTKYAISNDWHAVEIEWQASSAPGANNGLLSLWIDGTLMQTINGVDNDTHFIDEARLGALAGVDATTSGSMYFDHFESRRTSYIGLIGSATPTPTATLTPISPTNTPSQTPTPTQTNTPAITNTPTPTATQTFTPTASPTITATLSPTVTPPAPFNNATFLYDGDGRRVAQTLNGVTTYFIGAHYEVTSGVATKYYYAGSQRVAMRQGSVLYYLLGDHLGSTSLTTDSAGNLVSELRYKPWGETRYSSGTTPTNYQYTGQRNESALGLYFYNARWYDPYLNQFTQPDSIVPDPSNPQDWDRYSYVRNNPLKYNDPSGHAAISDSDGSCQNVNICRQNALDRYARNTLEKLSGKDDLEAIARVIDYAAALFQQYEDMIPALSQTFLGINESNPITVINASGANPCAAIGREPKDCGLNADNEAFWDLGFHSDFQDTHSQAFHFWAYVATAASTDMPVGGFALGFYIGHAANIAHENFKYGDPDGTGATWQDFALAQAGINTGEMIAFGLIQPNELGDYVRDNIGPRGGGAPYVDPLVQYWPLWGN